LRGIEQEGKTIEHLPPEPKQNSQVQPQAISRPSSAFPKGSAFGIAEAMDRLNSDRQHVNKKDLLKAITTALRGNFEVLQSSSKNTRQTGNDAETKAEGKYDTRSTEENYLADGLAKQALSAALAATACENMPLLAFPAGSRVALSALVEVDLSGEVHWFFLAPAGGGTEVVCEGTPVTLLTPESPLGSQLMGLKAGGWTDSPKARVLAVK
jgi:hypothetical protein